MVKMITTTRLKCFLHHSSSVCNIKKNIYIINYNIQGLQCAFDMRLSSIFNWRIEWFTSSSSIMEPFISSSCPFILTFSLCWSSFKRPDSNLEHRVCVKKMCNLQAQTWRTLVTINGVISSLDVAKDIQNHRRHDITQAE